MPQPAVVVVQTADELLFILLDGVLFAPRVDGAVGLLAVDAAVRAAVERDEQLRPRLFGPQQREDAPHRAEQLLEGRPVAEYRMGGELHRVELAAHHVALKLQAPVLAQHLAGRAAVLFRHPFGRVEAAHRLVEQVGQAAAAQTRIYVAVVGIQGDDLILPGLDREQRDVHAPLDADHHLLASGSGLGDDRRLDPLELPLGDAHAVALHQLARFGRVERQHVGVGGGDPPQVLHRPVREVGVVLFACGPNPGQKVVLGLEALHPVDFSLRGVHEDVVVEQRAARVDQFAAALAHLDVRGCEVFERGLSRAGAAVELGLQAACRLPLVVAPPRYGQRQHIPAYGIAVFCMRIRSASDSDQFQPLPFDFAIVVCFVQFVQFVRFRGRALHRRAYPSLVDAFA